MLKKSLNIRIGRNRCWMNNQISMEQAKAIMGDNFIGPEEIRKIEMIKFSAPEVVPGIPFTSAELESKKDEYILALGIGKLADGKLTTIRNLRDIIGKDPNVVEPCFYNQDWYDKESFIDVPMEDGWLLIRKNVYEESRAVQPVELLKKHKFPSAIRCTYAFLVAWLSRGIKLWVNDFVWCSDTDHNGDRVYVGKYHDIDGVNKNGFSIHRHLALRPCYGCID